MSYHTGDGADIGKGLKPVNLRFQGIILLLLICQVLVQRKAFFDNARQLSAPAKEFKYLVIIHRKPLAYKYLYRLLIRFFLSYEKDTQMYANYIRIGGKFRFKNERAEDFRRTFGTLSRHARGVEVLFYFS
jgi:hypothetical protein